MHCKKNCVKDFLLFRHMLMPILLQIIFWLGTIICIIVGLIDIFKGMILLGLQIFILGPIVVRVLCEFMILFFRINETLTEIKNELINKSEPSNPDSQ